MIVLSCGLQKSGSALFYNLINDMINQAGGACAREVKVQHNLAEIMAHHNNNIARPTLYKLMRLS